MTSILSNQSDITIPWNTYGQSSDIDCNLQFDQPEWNLQTDNIIDNNNEPIISEDDLDIVIFLSYLSN